MGWKKRTGEFLLTARGALDDADDTITSDAPGARSVDVLIKHLSKGFVATALALSELYGAADVNGKRSLRDWVGADVIDAAVVLAVSRGAKKEAA